VIATTKVTVCFIFILLPFITALIAAMARWQDFVTPPVMY
jgi:hypothetical protein